MRTSESRRPPPRRPRRDRIPPWGARAGGVALAAAVLLGGAAAGSGWRAVTPEREWAFPADHGAHRGFRTEWWYVTGHLETGPEPRRRFGYQLTFFRIGLAPDVPRLDSDWAATDLLMGHAAVTDLDRGTHAFGELLWREADLLARFRDAPAPEIAWSRGPAGTADAWTIRWNGSGFDVAAADRARGFSFRLTTRATKPLVLQGPNGYSRKSPDGGAASHYYSFTRLDTDGELEVAGERFAVRGSSWFDHEFATSQLGPDQVGWDWFGLQLADGRDVMLYALRRADGSVDWAGGTLVGSDGTAEALGPGSWRLVARDTWRSPASGAEYPVAWRLEIPDAGLELDVRAEVDDQENVSTLVDGLYYWEGAVAVRDRRGRPAGRGYVELTGYGAGSRPPV